jgi:hypothetical protein
VCILCITSKRAVVWLPARAGRGVCVRTRTRTYVQPHTMGACFSEPQAAQPQPGQAASAPAPPTEKAAEQSAPTPAAAVPVAAEAKAEPAPAAVAATEAAESAEVASVAKKLKASRHPTLTCSTR